MIQVLADTRALLARASNDFAWSRWGSAEAAVAEIDGIIGRIHAADTIRLLELEALYGPTSSLQEVAIESGWGDAFLMLASRFDASIADL
ncbi:hypothetical protein CA233_02875 [Sphingomonas sp. ABOLD]|nr:hypothetical protein CA233_02875 [Sphingomonas sp. ABOLD]